MGHSSFCFFFFFVKGLGSKYLRLWRGGVYCLFHNYLPLPSSPEAATDNVQMGERCVSQ